MGNDVKNLGQVFTPPYIVELILNEVGYKEEDYLTKTIFEPSFGEGVFLLIIVEKIIKLGISKGLSNKEIKNIIESNVFGVELDTALFNKTVENLNKLAYKYSIFNIKWNLFNENTIIYNYKTKNKFDFIVGNPPYIRLNNISDNLTPYLKDFKFITGVLNLYIIFFEIGINLLKPNGKLGFITPNSFIKNSSQSEFRKFLLENNLIESIIDFKSYKLFPNVDTYPAITILNNHNTSSTLKYAHYRGSNTIYSNNIPLPINSLYLALNKASDNSFLQNINQRAFKLSDFCEIQYGLTTNRDKVYISDIKPLPNTETVSFNECEIETALLRPVKKGSKSNNEDNKFIIFPYVWSNKDNKYLLIEEDVLKNTYPLTYKYLFDNKKALLSRNISKNTKWYEYGRSQGFKYLNEKRLTIGHIFKDNSNSLSISLLNSGEPIYSGIYIYPINGYSLNDIIDMIDTEEFIKYCSIVGRDLSGGFKVVTPKILKSYKPPLILPL